MNYPELYLEAIQSGKEIVGNKVRAVYERECAWIGIHLTGLNLMKSAENAT